MRAARSSGAAWRGSAAEAEIDDLKGQSAVVEGAAFAKTAVAVGLGSAIAVEVADFLFPALGGPGEADVGGAGAGSRPRKAIAVGEVAGRQRGVVERPRNLSGMVARHLFDEFAPGIAEILVAARPAFAKRIGGPAEQGLDGVIGGHQAVAVDHLDLLDPAAAARQAIADGTVSYLFQR